MGAVFRFKQFEVDQRDCAMKINTDGVLLGAIARYEQPKYILDVGTGTGVIALMLAQRFKEAGVDAVEIDEAAYFRSKENFANSIFSTRMKAYYSSFEDLESTNKYDLIISNPPFYTNSLHNPDEKKKLARHTDHDFFLKLLTFSFERLSPQGSLQLILPTELAIEVVDIGVAMGFFLERRIDVRSFENTESIRQLINLSKMTIEEPNTEELIIYKTKGEYTDHYKKLLSPFFLAY